MNLNIKTKIYELNKNTLVILIILLTKIHRKKNFEKILF